jgi:hypothetical protein
MFPGCLLVPVFLALGLFWVFGPSWSWIPFVALFGLLVVLVLAAGPDRVATESPTAAQSTSGTFSATLLMAIGIAIGLLIQARYWDLIPCGTIFAISAALWPRLRALPPL